jgi:hypothetical protein
LPASNKVSTQLLVSPHLRDRSRALAILRKESVAEVNRTALEGKGLAGLERQHADELSSLHVALNLMKVDKSEAFAYMLAHRLSLADLDQEGVRAQIRVALS